VCVVERVARGLDQVHTEASTGDRKWPVRDLTVHETDRPPVEPLTVRACEGSSSRLSGVFPSEAIEDEFRAAEDDGADEQADGAEYDEPAEDADDDDSGVECAGPTD